MPSMVCRFAAPRSPSTSTTRCPARLSANAKLTATVLLPTPPLPPATAMILGTGRLPMAGLLCEPTARIDERRRQLIGHFEQGGEQRRRCAEIVLRGAAMTGDLLRAFDGVLREQRRERDRLERLGECGFGHRELAF